MQFFLLSFHLFTIWFLFQGAIVIACVLIKLPNALLLFLPYTVLNPKPFNQRDRDADKLVIHSGKYSPHLYCECRIPSLVLYRILIEKWLQLKCTQL